MNISESKSFPPTISSIFAEGGQSRTSRVVLSLLMVAGFTQVLFFFIAISETRFTFINAGDPFPLDQWLRPLAALVIIALLWSVRSRPKLVLLLSLFPWLAGYVAAFLVNAIQGWPDRWVEIANSQTRSASTAVLNLIEFASLTLAFLLGASWLVLSLLGRVKGSESVVARLAQRLVQPSGAQKQRALRTSEKVLAATLLLFSSTLILKWLEPFTSGFFDFTDPGSEYPADQWLRLLFIVTLVTLVLFGLSIPSLLVVSAVVAAAWSTLLEAPLVVAFGQRDRLVPYNSTSFEAFSQLASFALILVLFMTIWVVVGRFILDYKRRVMSWAEKRSDHYAGVDLPVAGSEVRQQVSVLAILGLIFAFVIPILGLILSYAARNDIVVSKGHKTGFDMAVTASIIGWAFLILQSLVLVFLVLTGALAQSLPGLFFGDLF